MAETTGRQGRLPATKQAEIVSVMADQLAKFIALQAEGRADLMSPLLEMASHRSAWCARQADRGDD